MRLVLFLGLSFSVLFSPFALRSEESCSPKLPWHMYDSKNWIETWNLTKEKHVMALYDATGKRIEWRDWTGVTTFSYDFRGYLQEVIDPKNSKTGYEHDARGNLTKIAYPSGAEVTYGYHRGGILESITFHGNKITYEYDMLRNLLKKRSLPNGITTEYGYDAARRLADIVHQDAEQNLIAYFHFEYDAMDNRILTRKKTPSQEITLEYEYDKIYRLTQVRKEEGILEKYSYDNWGNRQTKETPEEMVLYTYDQRGWLQEAGETRYEYDENGFLKKKISPEETSTYIYNELGQLIQYEDDSTTVEFVYNGRGERLQKIVNGEATHYVYEQICSVFQILEEQKEDEIIQYVYGHGCLGYLKNGKMHYYLESDPGSSVGFILDEKGAVIEEIEYDPFGKVFSRSRSSFLYNKEQVDAETGLCFLRTRYYDPELGRFISPDQFPADAHNPQTLNRYAYANNNPLSFYDPMGTLPSAKTNSRPPILWSKGVSIREDDGPLPPEGMTWVVLCARKGGIFENNTYKHKIFRPFKQTGGHGWIEFVDSKGISTSISIHGDQDSQGRCACLDDVTAEKGYKFDQDTIRIAFPFEDTEVVAIQQAVEKFSEQKYNVFMHNCIHATAAGAEVAGISSFFEAASPTYAEDGHVFSWEKISTPSKLYSAIENTIDQLIGRDHPLISPPPELLQDVIWMHLATDDFGMPASRQQIELETQYFSSSPGLLATRGNFGGISLSKRAELKINLQEIYGAVFDEKTQQIILVGKKGVSLPEMRLDDLAVAIQSVYGLKGEAQDPGVSIEPSSNGMDMDVRYYGATYGTSFGKALFDADYTLKMLFNGKWPCQASEFYSFKDRWALHAPLIPALFAMRTWIVPEKISLVTSPDGSSMVFDEVKMRCLAESKVGDDFYFIPCHAEFAEHFTNHYEEIAAEYPIFSEIKRLGQITGIVKWLKDNQIAFDFSFFNKYISEPAMTPLSIPLEKEYYTHVSGAPLYTEGGVELSLNGANFQVSGIQEVDQFKEDVLNSRPTEETFMWEFKDAQRSSLYAEAFPLVKSRKSGNFTKTFVDLTYPVNGDFPLTLTRYYDSFYEQDHGLGIGWSLTPYSVAFSLKSLLQMGEATTEGSIALIVREHNQEWVYEPRFLESEGIWYFREDGRGKLLVHPDQTISLFLTNGAVAKFDTEGVLQSLTDRNDIWTKYHYIEEKLVAIEHQDNTQIQLEYIEDRLAFAKTPHGEEKIYDYDGERQLAAIKNGSGRRIHAYYYDQDLRLNKIQDEKDTILFEGDYDEYNRLSQVRTEGKQWTYDYNLAEKSAVITSPEGSTTEKKFNEKGEVFREKRDGQELFEKVFQQGHWEEKTFDVQGEVIAKYVFNKQGLPTEINDAKGNAWQFFYDAADRVILKKDPHGEYTCYQYDEKGRVSLKICHAANVVYDPVNKLVQATGKREDRTRYVYSKSGRLTLLMEGDEPTSFQYEEHGLLQEIVLPSGYTLRREFDEKMRVKKIADRGGVLKTFIFDEEGSLSEIISWTGSTQYRQKGEMKEVMDGNGNKTEFTYKNGQLYSVKDAEGATFWYH